VNRMAALAIAASLVLAGCAQSRVVKREYPVASTPRATSPAPRTATRKPPSAPVVVQPMPGSHSVTVRAGETLYGISRRYGLTVAQVAAWNDLEPPYTLRVGQTLRLAGSAPTTPASTASLPPKLPTPPATTTPSPFETVTSPPLSSPKPAPVVSTPTPAPTATTPPASMPPKPPVATTPSAPVATAPSPTAPVATTPMPTTSTPAPAPNTTSPTPTPAPTTSTTTTPTTTPPAPTVATPTPTPPATPTTPVATPPATPPRTNTPPIAGSPKWQWPTRGPVVGRYVTGDPTRQGIDIAGQAGQRVDAAADGVVVYSGAGLVGYGELVIVKHSDEWLSAYAHNRRRLVAEGTRVRAGDPIAEMGRSGAIRDMLHFEIRRNGKPVDPMQFLPPND
jgi:lipoprotein NlpD